MLYFYLMSLGICPVLNSLDCHKGRAPHSLDATARQFCLGSVDRTIFGKHKWTSFHFQGLSLLRTFVCPELHIQRDCGVAKGSGMLRQRSRELAGGSLVSKGGTMCAVTWQSL